MCWVTVLNVQINKKDAYVRAIGIGKHLGTSDFHIIVICETGEVLTEVWNYSITSTYGSFVIHEENF